MQGRDAVARFLVGHPLTVTHHVNGIPQGDLNAADHVNSLAGYTCVRTVFTFIREFARSSRLEGSSWCASSRLAE